jgi:hypothetical protein
MRSAWRAALLLLLVVPACAADPSEEATAGADEDVTGPAAADKKALFGGDFYYTRVKDGELSIWKADKRSAAHCPDAEIGDAKLVYKTKKFERETSGNFTANTPKASWKFKLDDKNDRLFKMKTINLKSMWNDVSQMREALAWKMFAEAGVDAPRHTYTKLCIDGKYFGLYSVIEHVDKTFLSDHFPDHDDGNLYKAYWMPNDLGPADLSKRADGKYHRADSQDDRTYQLKSNEEEDDYSDLKTLIESDDVDAVFDTKPFLTWAAVNTLLGAWDNYWVTPANYYLYNRGTKEAPKFVWIPWDYDNTFGISYDDKRWHDAPILETRLPLMKRVFAKPENKAFYLDTLERLNDSVFTERWVSREIDALWSRVEKSAFLESDTEHGAPHTGRQWTNHQIWQHGHEQWELNRDRTHIEGILHFVKMRHDSVKRQISEQR